MPGGPAKRLAKFAKDCKEKRLRPFSSYKTKKDLSEVLRKYGVEDERITYILQFVPKGKRHQIAIGFAQNHAKSSTRSCRGGNADHVDYAIKALEELICITEGKQHQIAMGLHRGSAFNNASSTGNEEVVSFLVKGDALGSQNVKEAKLEESAVDVTPSGFSAPNNANTKSTDRG
ncbi:hypothetical protein RhiirC2_714222 [Rhizophagus irregularis]|uniref:Uncharacterized protein n=1 Tax=Rhizophagus irregularis TaxID=588596 RepID=A0A2N1N059_9GLOM|nr:hypothetical protein RhiirC2_714222 [Rhizophagus irregularis]